MNFETERDEKARRAKGEPDTESGVSNVKRSPDSGSGEKSDNMGMTSEKRKSRVPAGDVGETLKSVYQRTVNEQIPPEMLDLLGKLG